MRQGATDAADDARRSLGQIALLLTLVGILGVLIVRRIGLPGVLNPGGISTFFEQYRRHEPFFLALMAAFAIGTALFVRRAARGPDTDETRTADVAAWGTGRLAVTALVVLVVTSVGMHVVMHAFPLSMDEYVAGFQAEIFASRRFAVTIPPEWEQFGRALTPVYVEYNPERNVWFSGYWPVYGALRALFVAAGAERFVNPLLAAASIALVYACARRLWPDDRRRAWLAVVFLATSSQFLFMSMAGYSMPAHLAANLVWLYAFARNDRAGLIAAPIVGVLALGLHNPFPHALFVAPFLLLVLARRQWVWTAYFAAVYLAGIVVWFAWGKAVWAASSGLGLLDVFARPSLLIVGVQHLSLTVLLSWQTPVLAVLLVWVAMGWRSLSTVERCLAAGVVASFLFYALFPRTQGHGWGYRYVYGVLGNMVLLGAVGATRLSDAIGRVAMRRLVIASALVTVFVQVPVRGWQIERYVRPFADAHAYVAQLDADVVIVDPTSSWYGIDLVRNDPFLRDRPKILSAFYLRPADKRVLAERFGGRVHLLDAREIEPLGVPRLPSRFKKPIWPPEPPPAGP